MAAQAPSVNLVRLDLPEDRSELNTHSFIDLRPYRFFDQDGQEFVPPSSVTKTAPQCEFCFCVFQTYSALYKHNGRPCQDDPIFAVSNNEFVRVVVSASRLFFISDALQALGLPFQASVDRVGSESGFEFNVDRSLLELTNRRLYLATCTKYNLDRYYDVLAAQQLTPRTLFMPLTGEHRKFLKALISTSMSQSLGMGSHLNNAEMKQREQLEDDIDAFLKLHHPNHNANNDEQAQGQSAEESSSSSSTTTTIPSVFLKFTTRSPKDAVAVGDDASIDMETRLRMKTEALLVNSGHAAVNLLSKSQRIYGDLHLFDQYGVAGTSSAELGLVFRDFMPDIRPELEFRCFIADGKRLTAISQYNCFDVFAVLQDDSFCQRVGDAIVQTHEAVRSAIPLPAYVADFAVVGSLDANPLKVVIIELNPFGADLGSGCCLFHWKKDYDLLYGAAQGTPVEMRVLKA